jgi:cell division protein FtsQ
MSNSLPLPTDVRLMNLAAALLLLVFVMLALGGGAWWVLRHPVFAIQSITVQGEVVRSHAASFRNHVVPQLSGNFFTLNLAQAQQAFQSVPWVREAVVHRVFPGQLRSVVLEHQPMATWGEEGGNFMVNEQGQVFEAPVEDVDIEKLPRMQGPEGTSQLVTRMYRVMTPLFETLDFRLEKIELTARGSWRVWTDSGALVELGRGTESELMQRVDLLLKTLPQVTGRYNRTPMALLGADLRHKDGYALRLRGVSTLAENDKNGLDGSRR